jgi:hypothetical protein
MSMIDEDLSSKEKIIKLKGMTYRKYVKLFASFYNLSDKEIEVMSSFMELKDQLINQKLSINAFSTFGKKEVASKLGIKNFNTLNNYIKRLKDKEVINSVDDGYEFDSLFCISSKQNINVKMLW